MGENEGRKLLNMLMPMDLLKRVDDFKFKQRFNSRTDAVKYLLEFALDKHNKGEGG